MKRLFIAFIMLLYVSHIFSQKIVISSNNGELEYMDGGPVLKDESYTCLNTKTVTYPSWHFVIFNGDDDEKSCTPYMRTKKLTFSVSDIDKKLFFNAKRIDVGDKSYFKGWIISEEDDVQDSLEVFFDLLPSKPLIEKAAFTYSYFDHQYVDFVDNYIDCIIKSENCNYLVMHLMTEASWWEKTSETSIYNAHKIDSERFDDALIHVKENLSYHWDKTIQLVACNAYGSQYGEEFTTKPYIPENILKYLESFFTGIDSPQLDAEKVIVNGTRIECPMEWKQLQVFGVDGICYYNSTNYQPEVEFPFSVRGLYIIKILLSNNNKIIKKVRI